METISRRERKKIATRDAIVDAAMELFIAQGYSATTVAQIAEKADISESTFFNHFPVKDELLLDGIDSKAEALLSMLADRPRGQTTGVVLGEYLGAIGCQLQEIARNRAMMFGAISMEPGLLELLIGRWSVTARPALLASFAQDLGEPPGGVQASLMTAIAMGLSNHLAYAMYAEGGDDEHLAQVVTLTLETLARSLASIEVGH